MTNGLWVHRWTNAQKYTGGGARWEGGGANGSNEKLMG